MNSQIQAAVQTEATIDFSKVLIVGKSYTVLNTIRFPTRVDFLIGKEVILKEFLSTSCRVLYGNNIYEIPNRSIINHPDYFNEGKTFFDQADAFVVTNQGRSLPIGSIIKVDKTVTVNTDNKTISFYHKGNHHIIESRSFVGLQYKNKSFPTRTNQVVKETNEVPIYSLLPKVDIDHIKNMIDKKECFDYEGNHHSTITETNKANELLLKHWYKQALVDVILREDLDL